jgi:hypothetical protein
MTGLLLNYEASAIVYQAVHENGLEKMALLDFGTRRVNSIVLPPETYDLPG